MQYMDLYREGLFSERYLRLKFSGYLVLGRRAFGEGAGGGAYYRHFTVYHTHKQIVLYTRVRIGY